MLLATDVSSRFLNMDLFQFFPKELSKVFNKGAKKWKEATYKQFSLKMIVN